MLSRAAVVAAYALLALSAQTHAARCSIRQVNYRGWSAQEIRNQWVTLTVVPKLGGRLMQARFGMHEYLFVNKRYEGKYLPPIEDSAHAKWYNYGGDKLWPLPEGHEDEQHWPGPVSDPLDDGDYQFSVVSDGSICKVRLDGPADPRTGLQYSREISVGADSPRILFHAVMKNASAHEIKWSVQSVTQYNTADSSSENRPSSEIWAFTAANESSSYGGGYFLRAGQGSPPGLRVEDGLVRLNYRFFESELWFDTQGGWLMVSDAASRYAMVERFAFERDKQYPGQATVIFYTNGSESPDDPLYYMEAEINSPMVRLRPGESCSMDTEWFPTRAGSEVHAVTDAGVVEKHLRASNGSGGPRLTGAFGVFYPGKLVASFQDRDGKEVSHTELRSITPLEIVELKQRVRIPKGATRIILRIIDSHGQDRGVLDEASIGLGRTSE